MEKRIRGSFTTMRRLSLYHYDNWVLCKLGKNIVGHGGSRIVSGTCYVTTLRFCWNLTNSNSRCKSFIPVQRRLYPSLNKYRECYLNWYGEPLSELERPNTVRLSQLLAIPCLRNNSVIKVLPYISLFRACISWFSLCAWLASIRMAGKHATHRRSLWQQNAHVPTRS